jgi:hypothetical protein
MQGHGVFRLPGLCGQLFFIEGEGGPKSFLITTFKDFYVFFKRLAYILFLFIWKFGCFLL